MKNLIKSILFLFIFIILFNIVFEILWLQKTPISYFYDEPKNSFDVVYVGGSNVYEHFNSVLAYNEYGFTTGLMSIHSQPFPLVKYLIKESEKYQKPNLYVIDITASYYTIDTIGEGGARETIDSMRFSKNRIDAINELLDYTNIDKSEYINYYFSFFKYHNSWKNISAINFFDNSSLYKGYFFSDYTLNVEAQDTYEWQAGEEKLSKEKEKVLINLIEYIKNNDLNVLFVIPKRAFTKWEAMLLNYATSIIEENGFQIINFNTLDDFEVDFSKDLMNFEHLNTYGATKYTLYFSKYLSENYDLKDHRNDPSYSSWDEEYERFKIDFKNITGKDFNNLIYEYKNNV